MISSLLRPKIKGSHPRRPWPCRRSSTNRQRRSPRRSLRGAGSLLLSSATKSETLLSSPGSDERRQPDRPRQPRSCPATQRSQGYELTAHSRTTGIGQTRLRDGLFRHGCSQLERVMRLAVRAPRLGRRVPGPGTTAFDLAAGIRRAIAMAPRGWLARPASSRSRLWQCVRQRQRRRSSGRSPLGWSAQGPENVESFRPAAAERAAAVPGRDRPGWKQTSAAAMAHATEAAHRHVAAAGTPTRPSYAR